METELTYYEMLLIQNGEDPTEARQQGELRIEIHKESQKLLNLPPSNWPVVQINWDLSAEGHRFALDGQSQCDFESNYPLGFVCGIVPFEELDRSLCEFSYRPLDKLWDYGFDDKLARVIEYSRRGLPLSPPYAKVNRALKNKLIFGGGHHRYAMCKGLGIEEIPILVGVEEVEEIELLLPSLSWL